MYLDAWNDYKHTLLTLANTVTMDTMMLDDLIQRFVWLSSRTGVDMPPLELYETFSDGPGDYSADYLLDFVEPPYAEGLREYGNLKVIWMGYDNDCPDVIWLIVVPDIFNERIDIYA